MKMNSLVFWFAAELTADLPPPPPPPQSASAAFKITNEPEVWKAVASL